ncbi:MAG: hypothetical protein J6B54_06865 [Clostridia bacterium]|nr:hypothetical protein [Clostridia bacterium]
MNRKQSIGTFLSNLLRNNNFLKILSVFLALFVWIYILYIVNPVNETVFDKVEVDLAFEGSVPDRNGYMYLMTDPNLTVRVTVSGSRSELLNLSKDDIKATLNMDAVVSEGTYSIAVSATTGNGNLKVTDIYPKNFTIEFSEEASREIPVHLTSTGTLPLGYEISEQTVSPEVITVVGPKKTVETISKAYITVPLTNVKENLSGAYDVSLVNEAGENVDRRYLTLSEESIEALINVHYSKTLQTTVAVANSFGGYNPSSFITVTPDLSHVTAIGPEKILSGLNELIIGEIDSSQITRNESITFPVPEIEGVTFDAEEISATVTISKDVTTKSLTFYPADIACTNIPSGKVPRVDSKSITIRIRGTSADLKKLTQQTLKCQVDMSESNGDGTYALRIAPVTSVSGVSFDVVGSYSVKVSVQ